MGAKSSRAAPTRSSFLDPRLSSLKGIVTRVQFAIPVNRRQILSANEEQARDHALNSVRVHNLLLWDVDKRFVLTKLRHTLFLVQHPPKLPLL
jgi:hypothetical protein